uniref:Secreted protein n=1 Tax=Brugia timori TaxID=42155 RepID=A0A0R3QQL8_9BILA
MTAKSLNAVLDNFLVAIRFYHCSLCCQQLSNMEIFFASLFCYNSLFFITFHIDPKGHVAVALGVTLLYRVC